MEICKPLTPEEKKWLAASTDPKKLRRALKTQYILAVLFAIPFIAGVVYNIYSQDCGGFGLVLLGAFAVQLFAQLFNIYVTRNQLREHDRLNQEENSK